MSRLFAVVLWAATLLALTFLLVPIAAIFLRVPPGDLVEALGSPVARDALRVTIATTLVAQLVILVVGTPAAYLLATRRFRGRSLAITLVVVRNDSRGNALRRGGGSSRYGRS